MRKGIILIIVIVILIIGVILRLTLSRRAQRLKPSEKSVAVEIMRATKGRVTATCELLGSIQADKTAQVFPEVMGRVNRILVKEGSRVGKESKLMAIRNETVGFEYEEAFVRSPISGNVAKILVDVGSMVTMQVPVALVVDFASVKVVFNVAEADIGCIGKNKKVTVEIDARPDRQFKAQISEISPVVDPMTKTISVKAVVNNAQQILMPGMTARVTLNLGEKNNVINVAKDALIDGSLFVVKDSTAERRQVTTGLIGDKNVEIIEGLNENEQVVIVGQERLAGGEKVKPFLRSK